MKLKQLEREEACLERAVAELRLDKLVVKRPRQTSEPFTLPQLR